MNKLFYFTTGWLSTLSFSSLLGSQEAGGWQETLLSLAGGVCSTVLIAWLRWRWKHKNSRRR